MVVSRMTLAAVFAAGIVSHAYALDSFVEFKSTAAKNTPSIVHLGKAPAPVVPVMDDNVAKADDNTGAKEDQVAVADPKPSKHVGPVTVMKEGEISKASLRQPIIKKNEELEMKKPEATEMAKADDAAPAAEMSAVDSKMTSDYRTPKKTGMTVAANQDKPETDDVVTAATGAGKSESEMAETPYKSDMLRQ